jgi:hypothetical protein
MNRSVIVAAWVHRPLRHHRQPHAAGGLRYERQCHHRGAGKIFPGLLVADVEQLMQPPGRGQHGQSTLHIDPDIAGVHRDRIGLGRRQPGREGVVHQQAPDMPVGDMASQLLDVHPAVPERAAFLIWLGDFGLEGDNSLKPWLEVRHRCSLPIGFSG